MHITTSSVNFKQCNNLQFARHHTARHVNGDIYGLNVVFHSAALTSPQRPHYCFPILFPGLFPCILLIALCVASFKTIPLRTAVNEKHFRSVLRFHACMLCVSVSVCLSARISRQFLVDTNGRTVRRVASHTVVIVLCTKLDAECDRQATVVGRLLTTQRRSTCRREIILSSEVGEKLQRELCLCLEMFEFRICLINILGLLT